MQPVAVRSGAGPHPCSHTVEFAAWTPPPACCAHSARIIGYQSIGESRGGKEVYIGQPGPQRPARQPATGVVDELIGILAGMVCHGRMWTSCCVETAFAGTQKTGTTWLFQALHKHSSALRRPGCALIPPLHPGHRLTADRFCSMTPRVLLCSIDCCLLLSRCVLRGSVLGVLVCGGRAVVSHSEISHLLPSTEPGRGSSRCGYYDETGQAVLRGSAVRGCLEAVRRRMRLPMTRRQICTPRGPALRITLRQLMSEWAPAGSAV